MLSYTKSVPHNSALFKAHTSAMNGKRFHAGNSIVKYCKKRIAAIELGLPVDQDNLFHIASNFEKI